MFHSLSRVHANAHRVSPISLRLARANEMHGIMRLLRILFLVFVGISECSCVYLLPSVKEIKLMRLKQESAPAINYKYVVKTILPMKDQWWKRGTHHFYAQEPNSTIVEA